MVKHCWLSGVLLFSLLPFFSAVAEPAPGNTTPLKPADVRILVDISGSMKETDPANLRIPAVNLLVELLPDGSQAGIWTFGRYVNMLVPLNTVDSGWRQQAKEKARSINSVGLYTNLTEALERARWKVAANSGYQHSVILLTDGHIDMREPGASADIDERERQRLLQEIIPFYAQAGARIHTLALSAYADHPLLQQISLETGGLYLRADSADELLKAFLKAFDRAVPVEQVPMVDNRFVIDASVKEFTALIFRRAGAKPTSLVAPDGRRYTFDTLAQHSNVRWHRDINFDLITIDAPAAGEWQADADIDMDNRVQILSDLNLRVEGLPDSLFSGNPVELSIALTEKGQILNEPAVLRLTDVTLKVTAPDGRSGSKLLSDPETLPADGVYRESMTRLSQMGEYQFEITAAGRTFQRRQVFTSVMQEPLRVESVELTDEQVLQIRVIPQNSVDTGLSRIIARITAPDTSTVIQSMDYLDDAKLWQLRLRAEKGPGEYEVSLNVRGVTAGGADFRTRPDDIRARFPLGVVAPPPAGESVPAPESAAVPSIAEPAAVAAEPSPAEIPAVPAVTVDDVPPAMPMLDLQAKFAEQEALAADQQESGSGMAWWVYAVLILGNMLVFGGAAAWWLMRKRGAASASEPSPASPRAVPDDLIREELTDDDFAGDFDAFDGEAEEEIPLPSSVPSSMGSDTDMGGFDDDFAIDPEPESADDNWGEFDTDDNKDGNNDEEPRPPV